MKLICSSVFFVAILRACFGQTTTFAPKSLCGLAALQCYTDQKALINSKFDAFDLASACQIFRTVLVCMENVGECLNDGDYLAVRQGCINDQYGICGVDGSLQSCGFDVQVCFNEMETVFKDADAKNFTAACPVINKFGLCVQNVVKLKECSPELETKLNQMQQTLENDKQLGGCDGPCAEAIGLCTLNATDLPTSQNILNLNFTVYCKSAITVSTCLKNLQQNPVCSSTSSSSGLDPSSYLQAITQNEFAKIGDVCNTDGTPADCLVDLTQCALDLIGIPENNSTAVACQAASDFLECTSKLPCMTSMASIVADFRNDFETDEYESQCPQVGSCNERFSKCSLPDELISTITDANKEAVCTNAKKSITCFEFVESDPYCINEKGSLAIEEQAIMISIIKQCGDAGGTFPPVGSTSAGSPCVQAVARCKVVQPLPASQSIFDWDASTYCQTANTVYSCFDNLTQSSICSRTVGGINESEYMQAERDNVFAKIGDVCNRDGSSSSCVNDLYVCHDALRGQNNAIDTNSQCQGISTFLECSSSLPCGATLTPLIENFKKTLENEETKKQCPSVGNCKERFQTCGQQEQALVNSTQSNNDAACKKLRSCFDSVKNDPNCINEKESFTNEENDAEDFLTGQCGRGASILLSLKLIAVSLMLCLKQCL